MPVEDKFIQLAVRHGLLDDEDAAMLQQQCDSTGCGGREVAVRNGVFDGRQIDILEVLESPKDVAPGYEVLRVLGTGGFGVVYEATQLNLSRNVALKTIPLSRVGDSTATKRFEQEASIVGKLRHPNIITAIDFGLHNRRLYLSMEYVKGIDLDRATARRRKLDEVTCWYVIRQVAIALKYASEHGVVHRDIKPGNIMLTEASSGYAIPSGIPLVKVADFGLACFNSNEKQTERITLEGSTIGTPFYVAPEQLMGVDVDQRSDIYSMGATAWHMLSGGPPMDGSGLMSVVARKLSGDISWLEMMPPEWSAETKQLIRDMCGAEPTDRIQSHDLLIGRIDRLLAGFDHSSIVHELDAVVLSDDDCDLKPQNSTAVVDLPEKNLVVSSNTSIADSSWLTPNEFNSKKTLKVDRAAETKGLTLGVSRRRVGWLGGVVCAGVLISAGAMLTRFGGVSDLSSDEGKLTEFAGAPVFLFNGTNVDPTQRFSGKWSVEEGVELGSVLAGDGSRTFSCVAADGRPMEFFSFRLGFLHHQADLIEVQVFVDGEPQVGGVRIDTASATLFQGEDSTAEDSMGALELRQFDDGSQGYYTLRIERHVGYWEAFLDGNSLGKLPTNNFSKAQIRVVVTGRGSAHFEGIQLNEFAVLDVNAG